MAALPMFPLGTVLVPGAGLPLHVFEPRYRQMVRDCLAADRRFGVVLIERGSEVGGGDVRSDVGAFARIEEATELPDGRWAMIALGTGRFRVHTWLPDDPYPRAEVDGWPDPPPGPDHDSLLAEAVVLLRRSLALTAEAGEGAPPATFELAADPVLAGHQAVALAPLGPLDRQSLLAAPTPEDRVRRLTALLTEEIATLELRLGGA
jgi:Lon protease-like protein